VKHRFTHFILLLFGIILIFFQSACAGGLKTTGTGPDVQWYKTFGGGKDDWGNSVKLTRDGGYIICGSTTSYGAGNQDLWLVKTDANGNKLWDKTFGGEKNEVGFSIQQTTDGGYIVCGATESYGAGGADAWLVKTDASGNKLWDKTFGGAETDAGYSVQQTTDGGYILCGSTKSQAAGNNEMWLIKTDVDGNKLWDKTFSGKGWTTGVSVQQTKDGGYIACGSTGFIWDPNQAIWITVTKTDASGNKEWDNIIGGDEQERYTGTAVLQTTDGDYIVYGRTDNMDALLIKIDSKGNKLWDKKYREIYGAGNSIQQTTDDGYIVCGTAPSFEHRSEVVWLMKTDVDGNEEWIKTFGNEKATITVGHSVQQTMDGGYVVCGTTYRLLFGSDVLLVKVAPDK
jgi:hypothetical protein